MKSFMTILILVFANCNLYAQSPLLTDYYEIKEALVNSNAQVVSAKAAEFIRVVSGPDMNNIPDLTRSKLRAAAEKIETAKDISKQREYFAGLSSDLFLLVKTLKLPGETIYLQYCPMKNSYWLSNNAAIRNPYYGKSMLSCGNIKETITP
jgi:hypothetical protein